MSQLIGAASGYEEILFDVRIPSLTDTANIVEAFKIYHFGIDNYNGDVEPAANSIHSWLKDFDERINTVEASTTITLTGTANEVNVSASVGNIIVGLPDDVTIGRDLTVTRDLYVSDDAQINDNLTVLGAAIFATSGSVMSGLTVDGATALGSSLTVANTASVASNLTVSGSANIVGNISTSGSATIPYATITTAGITDATIGTSTFTGTATFNEITEVVSDLTLVSNSASPSFSDGTIFFIGTAPTNNFTLDFQNVPTTNGRVTTISVITTQGSTGYYPSTIRIGGSSQTVRWAFGVNPTPTSNAGDIDVFNFTLIRRSGTWVVLGNINADY